MLVSMAFNVFDNLTLVANLTFRPSALQRVPTGSSNTHIQYQASRPARNIFPTFSHWPTSALTQLDRIFTPAFMALPSLNPSSKYTYAT